MELEASDNTAVDDNRCERENGENFDSLLYKLN